MPVGKTLRDRMVAAGSLWSAMASRFDAIVVAINQLSATLIAGNNPHKVNDTADIITMTTADTLDQIADCAQVCIDNYETHIASTTYHVGADSTNVVTELGLPKEIYGLLNLEKSKYNLNRVNVTTHHGSADSTNIVAAADATTKATAVTLANQTKTKLLAHMAMGSTVHGTADIVNGVALAAIVDLAIDGSATWDQIRILVDAIRVAYEAHRVYTTSAVHAGADSTNTLAANAAVGTTLTAVQDGLNELKGDMNVHMVESGTYHQVKDLSILITSANATTLATARVLVAEIKQDLNDHFTRADQGSLTTIPSLDLDE